MSEQIELDISFGKHRADTNWRPEFLTDDEFIEHLRSNIRRTSETMEQFDRMPPKRKQKVKDGPAFVGGLLRGGRRKKEALDSRSLITLDVDHADENFLFSTDLILGGSQYLLYSTHSHRPDKPKYRLIVFPDRRMSPDEYAAASRKLAELIGMEYFDKTTFDVHRLMYLPSCSKDAEPVFEVFDGEPLSVDGLLTEYDDWRDPLQWPRHKDDKAQRQSSRKMEDPRAKLGIVGAFCRCYSISQAIAEFLPDVYESAADDLTRYTYVGSTSFGGLVVYDEDTFAYSHHETDPISGREVNAFDLVRIHKFGELDEGAKESTEVTQLPSFIAMRHWAETLEDVKKLRQVEATAEMHAEFGDESFDIEVQNSTNAPAPKAVVPLGFKVINGKLYEVKETRNDIKHIPVCDCLVMVTKRHVNLTDGTHGLDVSWKNGNEIRSISNTRGVFMDTKKLIGMADHGLPVHSGNVRAMTTYFSCFEAQNRDIIPTELVSNQMGWIKDGFLLGEQFIGGSSPISFLPKDAGDGQTAKGFHTKGSIDKTFEVLEQIKPYAAVKLAVYAALAAPLLELIDESSFIFELAGGTSRGKTTALRIAASLFGCPDEQKPGFFKQWNMTKVYIERYASTMNHLPLFIDDTQKADPKIIPSMIYHFAGGQGRGRGSLKGSQIGSTWCTVLLSTGEQKLTSFSKAGGTVARILSLQGSPFESTDAKTGAMIHNLNKVVSHNYGHLAEPWIRFLLSVNRDSVESRVMDVLDAYTRLASGHGEVAMRLARIMAILDATGQMFDECFGTTLYDAGELQREWLKTLTGSSEIDRALEALDDVMGWVTSHNKQFIKGDYAQTSTVLSGRIKEDEIMIIGEQLDTFLQSKGYDPNSIARSWKENGWLNTEEGRTKKKVRIAGGQTRAYSFNLRAMGWAYEVGGRDYSEFGQIDEEEVPV